ncbi:MAG: hypothetical protein LBV43_06440 [Prevotella sp.]|jgi:hypothetical protein|nr:hypothetical protein [Prevotella sp.]
MKKTISIITLLCISYISLFSQVTNSNDSIIDTSIVTLYEYGQPIESCDCNFENLFRNWTPQFITNAKDIKLISYEFVETLKEDNIDYYVDWFIQPNGLGSETYGNHNHNYSFPNDSVVNKEIKNTRYFHPRFTSIKADNFPSTTDFEKIFIEVNKLVVSAKKIFREKIKIDDKVYLIRFEYGGQTLKNYVICNPETNKIIQDNVFLISSLKSNIRLY